MSTTASILLSEFDNIDRAIQYAMHISRMAELNANTIMQAEYENAAEALREEKLARAYAAARILGE